MNFDFFEYDDFDDGFPHEDMFPHGTKSPGRDDPRTRNPGPAKALGGEEENSGIDPEDPDEIWMKSTGKGQKIEHLKDLKIEVISKPEKCDKVAEMNDTVEFHYTGIDGSKVKQDQH